VLETPEAIIVVPLHDDGRTVLVRQWRHSWESTSWELPAGTLEMGEDPLEGARRELTEEAGLTAREWGSLGTARASAVATLRYHFFLARGLQPAQRAPEIYEQDMIVRELPFHQALEEALEGGIQHAGSISALARAARALERLGLGS
jgi:8-oxo-dGTP pyrophosphatase MutT (NUDIX family)